MTSHEHESADQTLTLREGYLAMYRFVSEYFERGGERDEGMVMLVTNLRPQPNRDDPTSLWTDDPAFWSDWLDAVEQTKSGTDT